MSKKKKVRREMRTVLTWRSGLESSLLLVSTVVLRVTAAAAGPEFTGEFSCRGGDSVLRWSLWWFVQSHCSKEEDATVHREEEE